MSEIVRSQGLKYTTINYIGVVIGALSTFFVYPHNLSLYGFYGFLTNTASLLAPFVSFGFGAVILRYFPFYRNKESKTDGKFLFFIVTGYSIGIILFVGLFFIFKDQILALFQTKDIILVSNYYYIIPLTILFVLYELFCSLSTTHKLIAIPTLLSNSLKIILPLLFILCIKEYINYTGFLCYLIFYYVLILIILLKYIRQIDPFSIIPNKEIFKVKQGKEMIRFALYSMITTASAVLALRIDTLMISSQIGMEANGTFSMAHFISNAVWIPALGIYEILTAFVSESSKNGDKKELQSIYTKSVRNMLIPTFWASLCIYLNFDYMVQLLPNSEKLILIKPALGFLLIARIIDAGTGVNHHILSFSKYYRIELFLLIGLAILNIGFNLIFIPKLGIIGAALGTMLAVSIFNITKSLIIYWKLSLQPFDFRIINILLCVSLIFFGSFLLPKFSNIYYNMILLTFWVTILFMISIFYFGISPEFKSYLMKKYLPKF